MQWIYRWIIKLHNENLRKKKKLNQLIVYIQIENIMGYSKKPAMSNLVQKYREKFLNEKKPKKVWYNNLKSEYL